MGIIYQFLLEFLAFSKIIGNNKNIKLSKDEWTP